MSVITAVIYFIGAIHQENVAANFFTALVNLRRSSSLLYMWNDALAHPLRLRETKNG